jgi:hypothetical protein
MIIVVAKTWAVPPSHAVPDWADDGLVAGGLCRILSSTGKSLSQLTVVMWVCV